jgi:hypothetical protein
MADAGAIMDSSAMLGEDSSDLPWYLQDANECASALLEKRDEYFSALRASGVIGQWQLNWSMYYGTDPSRPGEFASAKLSRVGNEREYTRIRINDFRSFLRQQIQTALGPKPAFKSTTRTTDVKTLAAIPTLDRGIQHIMDKAWPQKKRRRLLERAILFGAGLYHVRWDKDAGDATTETQPVYGEDGKPQQKPMMDPTSGQPLIGKMGVPVTEDVTEEIDCKTGMPTIDVGSPWECYYDPQEEEELTWIVATETRSKWELATLFPDQADSLRALDGGGGDDYSREKLFGGDVFRNMSSNDDKVLLHHFYLGATADAPDGRYLGFVEGCDVLWDRTLPVETSGTLPVGFAMPAPYIGAAVGYADASDLIPIQQGIDNVTSDWMSNSRAFGRAVMLNPKGSGINLEGIRAGLVAVDYNAAGPAPSYLVPPKFDNAIDLVNYMHRRMESVSQQNAVRRGDPQANIKSGTMAALFNQQSVDFVSDVQQSFDEAENRIANIALELAQVKAKGEFLIKVTGQGSRPYWEAFHSQGLKGIQDIEVETISAMMRSPAGRFEYWQQIQTVPPEKQAAVRRGLETGDWSGLDDEDSSEDMRLIAESELLLQGKNVLVSIIDDPVKHMKQHKADLMKLEAADPTMIGPPPTDPMTGQPAVDPMTGEPVPGQPIPGQYDAQKRAITDHMTQHGKLWQLSDPRTNALLGLPAPPPMPGTPTGDLAMMLGGGGVGAPPGAEQQQGGPPPQKPQGGPPPGPQGDPNQAGGQPKQPQPAQPAQPPEAIQ